MITIKKATVADVAVIAALGRQSFIESHGHSAAAADIDYYVSRKYAPEAIEADMSMEKHIFHLILLNERPAGYSKIILDRPHENIPANNVTCLDRLYLLKQFYDMKLGRQLFDFNLNISRQAGQAGIWLYTWVENKRAIAFYERAGFKIVGNASFPISPNHANPNHVMFLAYGDM